MDPPLQTETLQLELNRIIESTQLFDDSQPTLDALRARGIKTALVSNLSTPYKAAFYAVGLEESFDEMIFSCDVALAKPDQAIYRTALQSLNAEPEECLMVGDSLIADVQGPEACGIRGVLLDRKGKSEYASRVSSLSEIGSLFERAVFRPVGPSPRNIFSNARFHPANA